MRKDPYLVLGVEPKASQEDINKAFRSLAAKHHPDKNLDNKEAAAERFKEVAAAYELLGDVERRRQYDAYKSGRFSGFGFRSRNSVDDMFDNLFSQVFGKGKPHPSISKSKIKVSLSEAFYGCSKVVKSESHEPCKECSGTGSPEWSRCSHCDGSGFLFTNEGPMKIQTACVQCSGRGSVSRQSCRHCNGRGHVVVVAKEVEVKIPPGIEDGMQVRLSGEGADGTDLFVFIVVERHPYVERHQRDLISRLDVSYSILTLGGEAKFTLFDSEIHIKIPPRTRAGSRLRIKNQGMPAIQNPNIRGDLFVELGLLMPSSMSAEYEKAIRSLSKFEKEN